MSRIRLKEIASTITKGTTPTSLGYDFVEDGINFIKIESISESGAFRRDKFAHINDECNKKLERSQLQENDILFSIAGAIGRVAIVDRSVLPANTNQALAIIRVPEGIYNYDFLKYVLESPIITRQFEKQKQGVAQINLSLKNIGDFEIPNIPIEEQKRITGKLDSVKKVIQWNKELLEVHDTAIRSRFLEVFGEPFLNPKNWDVAKIEDVVTEVRYGTSRPAVEGGKYPYMRMNNLTFDGHLDLTDLKYIDIPDNEIEKCIVRKGDVLFNRTNSVELVGKTCVFDLEEEMVIAGYIIRVRLNEKVLPEFLSAYMNSAILKAYLRSMAKGAVNQANINAQELQGIKIYLPPIELQQQFAEFVEQVEKAKQVIKQQLEELETLKKSLMQKYFG